MKLIFCRFGFRSRTFTYMTFYQKAARFWWVIWSHLCRWSTHLNLSSRFCLFYTAPMSNVCQFKFCVLLWFDHIPVRPSGRASLQEKWGLPSDRVTMVVSRESDRTIGSTSETGYPWGPWSCSALHLVYPDAWNLRHRLRTGQTATDVWHPPAAPRFSNRTN